MTSDLIEICNYLFISTSGDKHNEEEVRQALDKLCGYLPKTINQKCTKFVDTYSDLIIDLVTHDLTPDQVIAIENYSEISL